MKTRRERRNPVGGRLRILVFLLILFSICAEPWTQCTATGAPLDINYTSLSMSCGASQTLSASGGCPPYNWILSGGGTLTPSGGDNTSATYVAPGSNPNCANNAMITLTDGCRNSKSISLAVNCYIFLDVTALVEKDFDPGTCHQVYCFPYCIEDDYQCITGAGSLRGREWACDGTLLSDCTEGINLSSYCLYTIPSCDINDIFTRDFCGACRCPANVVTGPWDTLFDIIDVNMKQQGCCPLNPITGLPYDHGILDDEQQGKNAGNPLCQNSVGNPVNVATGNKYEEVLDLTISTPGIPLEFKRSYNSQVIFDSPLGYGWTHTYDVSLGVVQTSPTKRVRIWDSDGKALYFNQVQQTSTEILFGGESGVKDRLKQAISTGEYLLRRKEGNLTYRFGPDGKLLEIFDPNGNTLAMTYDGSNRLSQISNNFGRTISIHYTGNRIDYIQDPKGQSILYEYTNGDLTKVTYPDQNFVTYAYSSHDLTDKYDTNNNLFGHWGYDNRHRVINYYSHLKDGVLQERIDLSYQPGGTVVTRSTGATTYHTSIIDGINVVSEIEGCSTCGSPHKRFAYSDRLDLTDLTAISDSQEHTTHFSYDNPANPWDQVGEILSVTEAQALPEARTTTYTYTHRTDDPFLLTQSTETKASVAAPEQNKVITIAYDTAGNIASRQESGYVLINGVPTSRAYTTGYQYNSYDKLTQINGPRTDLSDITTLEYYDNVSGEGNNRGQLKAIVDALGHRTSFSDYDANGNMGTITDPNAVVTFYTYDERNRVKTITNQATNTQTQYFYNSHGNLGYVISPEGNRIDFNYNLANKVTEIRDTLGDKIAYGYDIDGNRNREEVKDPQGALKKYLDFTYDPYNRLKMIINPDTTYTEYSYDGFGNRTALRDPRANTTGYAYNSFNRLSAMTEPDQIVTGYGYDSHDNLTLVTDPKQNATQYSFDDFGRRQQTISPDTLTTSYLYDEAGNLSQKIDANGTVVTYNYDALNRLTAIQFPDSSQNITYAYDSPSVSYGIGRLTGRVDPSGSYAFHYNAHGNLKQEEKTIGGIIYATQYDYNKDNILTSITYPTGRSITYAIDQVGRVSQVSTLLNGNPKTLASSISYLPFGGVMGLTYGNNLTLVQGYDDQYRTSSIVVGSLLNRTYGYDPNGNITSIVDSIEPVGNQALERTETYTYLSGTNLLAEITAEDSKVFDYDQNGNTTLENNRFYIYDASNQLIKVLDGTMTVAEYVYNGSGQRIKKILPTETRIFHYDLRGHIIVETDQSGQMLAEYIYLGDQVLAMIRPGENVSYYHNDHLGTPQILTDGNGSVAWKASYTPFGKAEISIETVENPFRFPGQYYDRETGLHYNYFRYYNPGTGRYITPDPIGLAGGINLFAYAANNSVNWIDPRGLSSTSWKGWAGYIIGGAGIAVAGVTGVTGVGLVVGGVMVGVGAALIIWDAYEDYETIDKADKKYVDPLRKELEENEKALKQLENGNNTKSNNCREKGK